MPDRSADRRNRSGQRTGKQTTTPRDEGQCEDNGKGMALIQPVILSGGAGTRLWPASRSMFPKQLLPLTSDKTMLQETLLRLNRIDGLTGTTFVICNEAHRFLVAEQIREIGIDADIVLEPEGKNTAPAAALAALLALANVKKGDAAPLLLIMPADHIIQDGKAFVSAINTGAASAEHGVLVTFGVVPSYPHTGYGYIEADARTLVAVPVDSFIEKPDQKTAVNLLETNRFFWNSGIFLFRADSYIEELEKFVPEMVAACRKSIDKAETDADFIRPDADSFRKCPADSLDYAVMEKTEHAAMVQLDAGWSDVGSWAAVHDFSEQDDDGNVLTGDVVSHGCRDSLVSSKSRLVAAVGLRDMIVVEDRDSVLVARKDKTQDVKLLVEKLKKQNREEIDLHRQVFRPWGSYDSIDSDEGFQVKRLIVNPGAILSLQKHAKRSEHWVVVRGTARITLDDKVFDLNVNESTHIPIGAVHRIENAGDEPVHIIEVQCGDYLGEDDIERIEDEYGREGTNT
jgi:mannose-1-phosphate guanylyltransferase/mannose-6-phosphate isomerase